MVEVIFGGKGGRVVSLSTDGEEFSEIMAEATLSAKPFTMDVGPLIPLANTLSLSFAVSKSSLEAVPAKGSYSSIVPAVRSRDRLASAFAKHMLIDRDSKRPVGFTERIYVRFEPDARPNQVRQAIENVKWLRPTRKVRFAPNAYVLEPTSALGTEVFDLALALLEKAIVSRCHPELLRPRQSRSIFPRQWHLGPRTIGGVRIDAHANVEAAWATTRGANVNIAVIDDGIDAMHPELKPQIISQFDSASGVLDGRPREKSDNHGTACAGIAVAAGRDGASGVAPEARLIAIRNTDALGSLAEAEAFEFAARHGADVISCSWGPEDGRPDDPNDPLHFAKVPMSDLTADAVDHCLTAGRNGRGCVITWAAGNGNESVDNDGYAAHPGVIAVAACNDRGTRSYYSDTGTAISCAFPSNDRNALTTGIWTTDRRGSAGYNPGNSAFGDAAGHYTSTFGGTSSACPGVAGVAALVLSVNADLTAAEVRFALESTADKIDQAGGRYDGRGHSPFYGFGRVNAAAAVAHAVNGAIV